MARKPLGLPAPFPGRSPISSASHPRRSSGLVISVAFTQPSSCLSLCSWNWEGWKPSKEFSVPCAKSCCSTTKGCAPANTAQDTDGLSPAWTCCWSMLSPLSAQAPSVCQQSSLPALSLQPLVRQGLVCPKYRTLQKTHHKHLLREKKLKQHQIEPNTRHHAAHTGNQDEESHQKVFPNCSRVLSTCQELLKPQLQQSIPSESHITDDTMRRSKSKRSETQLTQRTGTRQKPIMYEAIWINHTQPFWNISSSTHLAIMPRYILIFLCLCTTYTNLMICDCQAWSTAPNRVFSGISEKTYQHSWKKKGKWNMFVPRGWFM